MGGWVGWWVGVYPGLVVCLHVRACVYVVVSVCKHFCGCVHVCLHVVGVHAESVCIYIYIENCGGVRARARARVSVVLLEQNIHFASTGLITMCMHD